MQKNKPSHCYTRFFIGEHSASPSPLPRPREGRSWFRPHSIQGKVTCSVGDSAQDASSPNLQVGTGLSIEHFRVSGEHLGFLWSTLGLSTCQSDTCQTALGSCLPVAIPGRYTVKDSEQSDRSLTLGAPSLSCESLSSCTQGTLCLHQGQL